MVTGMGVSLDVTTAGSGQGGVGAWPGRALNIPSCSHSCEQLQRCHPLRAMCGQHTCVLSREHQCPQEQWGLRHRGHWRNLHPLRAPGAPRLWEQAELRCEARGWGQLLLPQVLVRPQRLVAQGTGHKLQAGMLSPTTRVQDKAVPRSHLSLLIGDSP